MPQMLAGAILPWVIQGMGMLGIPLASIAASASLVAAGLSYLAFAGLSYLVSSIFAPGKPEAPKPEDGKYNLKQSVPPLAYVLGRVKKAGDYMFLEERDGVAYHITAIAAHRVQRFVEHWLHDERVTLDGSGWVAEPAHFVYQPRRVAVASAGRPCRRRSPR